MAMNLGMNCGGRRVFKFRASKRIIPAEDDVSLNPFFPRNLLWWYAALGEPQVEYEDNDPDLPPITSLNEGVGSTSKRPRKEGEAQASISTSIMEREIRKLQVEQRR